MLLGHWVEMASVQGASQALESLKELVPAQAHLLRNGKVKEIPVNEVTAEDVINCHRSRYANFYYLAVNQ